MDTVWFSFDVETDGPGPIYNSMISLGIAVFSDDGHLLDQFEVNIEQREDCEEDPDTMEWWQQNQAAWKYCQQKQVAPLVAMYRVAKLYKKWSADYDVKWVAQPACFDWMFLKSYYEAFPSVGNPHIGYSCTDFSSLRETWLNILGLSLDEYKEQRLEWMKEFYVGDLPAEDSHRAVEDALFQGIEFLTLKQRINAL